MKQIIITTVILSFLWSCGSQSKKEISTESDNSTEQVYSDFEEYISSLDKITLPLKHNPFGKLPELSKNFDKIGFKKFKHTWASQPLGIYYKDEKTIGIIDCSIGDWGLVPFLTIYDLEGNKIDSTNFYTKSGKDMGYEAIEYVTFYYNKSITVLDTVNRSEINEDKSDIIEGTMKTTTGKIKYQILENGRIKKIEFKNKHQPQRHKDRREIL